MDYTHVMQWTGEVIDAGGVPVIVIGGVVSTGAAAVRLAHPSIRRWPAGCSRATLPVHLFMGRCRALQSRETSYQLGRVAVVASGRRVPIASR